MLVVMVRMAVAVSAQRCRQLETRLSDAEQRDVITNGRKAMPRFGETLTDEEIDAIVRYSREIL